MRALWILGFVGCASGPPYQLSVHNSYEVGEDPTIAVAVAQPTQEKAILIVTRPDGSTVRQRVSLGVARNNIRFGGTAVDKGTEVTFTERGDYRVELRNDNALLAKQEIRISVDQLTKLFEESEIADFAPVVRYTRPRGLNKQQWKTYGALYEHTLRKGVQIHVLIEDPGDALSEAWKQYEEEGTLGVIENNYVRFRDRNGSVSASWISGKKIVAMRAERLEDFERGFIGAFLARFPSRLGH